MRSVTTAAALQRTFLYPRKKELNVAYRSSFFLMAQAGPEDDTIREMVGTPVPAWAARDPPRSTSPKGSAAPGLPTLADWPDHPHHSVNCVEAWIETLLCSPPHVPPVDLESSHIFEGLQPI